MTGAVGGAAGLIHVASSATTGCQNSASSLAYINGVSEEIFNVGMCLPAGPYVSEEDVKYIVETIKSAKCEDYRRTTIE